MKIVFAANIIVAGWIGISALFYPKYATATIFQSAYQYTDVVRLVGCLWLSIAILSLLGLWKPMVFSPVLLLQLIYKGSWLAFVALPAILHHQPYPKAMACFFVVWVLVLPLVIPWQAWMK